MLSDKQKCECGTKRCQLEQEVSQQCVDFQKALQNPRVRKPIKDAIDYILLHRYFSLPESCSSEELRLWGCFFNNMHREVQADLQTQWMWMPHRFI